MHKHEGVFEMQRLLLLNLAQQNNCAKRLCKHSAIMEINDVKSAGEWRCN